MIPRNIKEMEPRIKQRFHFASSAFSRLFGVPKVTEEMTSFSLRWAKTDLSAPLDSLTNVDRYFKDLWDRRDTIDQF